MSRTARYVKTADTAAPTARLIFWRRDRMREVLRANWHHDRARYPSPPLGTRRGGDFVARVLIVGGAGYVGGWLTDRALEAGHDVTVYDLLLYEDVYLKPVDFVFGDILDHDRLEPHVRRADVVVWLAALVGDGACALDPELTRKINVDSVRWLTSVYDGRIVFMSSCSVYGA